jgi:hypothetical protein
MAINTDGFIQSIKDYLGMGEPTQPKGPVYGLENQTPYSYGMSLRGRSGWGLISRDVPPYDIYRAVPNYWEKLAEHRGIQVIPNRQLEYYRGLNFPLPTIPESEKLIFPTTGDYADGGRHSPPSELFINGMGRQGRGVPNNIAPRIAVPKRVIRMNTPEEKAAYLASQAERGFQMVGEPYTPVTDTRLAPTSMVSTERVPFYNDYRAGQGMRNAGRAFMTPAQALRYVPQYLNDPRTIEALGLNAGRAAQGLAIGLTPIDALNRRERNFTDFYERTGRDPSTLEDYGLRIKSGLEPALSLATFGAYDALADTPTYRAYLDQEQRDRAEALYRQQGIDYPVIAGQRFERTTK